MDRSSASIRPVIGIREREVLFAWFRCGTKAAAARELFVTINTVKTHIERVRDKYEAVGRPAPTQALLLIRAIQDGWIDITYW
ncbi:LuxR family transcriptional regulator [Mycolicibacterium vanbaalenii PYR-1]|nr:LuxR family transcriptional regulator [Mycolicibacterium vanbaalenii PYR-1]